jgi:hypothetical protein
MAGLICFYGIGENSPERSPQCGIWAQYGDRKVGGWDRHGDFGRYRYRSVGEYFVHNGRIGNFGLSFLLNIFLSGGVFDYLKDTTNKFSFPVFFSASARNFKSFFSIKLLSGLLLSVLLVFIYLFIVLFNLSASLYIKITVLALAIVLFLLYIQILAVTDYARAKRALNPGMKGTKALEMGFKTVFSNILPFFLATAFVSAIQLVVVILAIRGIIAWVPRSGFALFALFVATQLLYLVNVHLKIWRFGTVTDLMRQISVNPGCHQKNVIPEPCTEGGITEW